MVQAQGGIPKLWLSDYIECWYWRAQSHGDRQGPVQRRVNDCEAQRPDPDRSLRSTGSRRLGAAFLAEGQPSLVFHEVDQHVVAQSLGRGEEGAASVEGSDLFHERL
jgi:hypothetical protein